MHRSAFLIGLLLVALSAGLPGKASPGAPGLGRPNIVFILTDDEDVKIHGFMPKTKTLLEDQGTVLANFFVTYSLCCPSRASILRGQYPHNTEIQGNTPPLGGFAKFAALGRERSTIATWLQGAGYRTVFAGKYLNGYGTEGNGPTHVPPGWNEWYGGVGGRPYANFNYDMNENGTIVAYGQQPEDYLTDVIARKAVEAIRRAARARQPVFLYLAPYTPHAPATAAPRHANLYGDAALPRPPSFNEADLSDKPMPERRRPLLTPAQIQELETLYRRRLRSLQAIDDLVESVVAALREAGQLENSYIIYTSDNGFHMGEHRLRDGKGRAYEEDIRVPFIVRGPGVPAGRRLTALVLNIDIAPTVAEIAGVAPPAFVDGRSFLGLLRGTGALWRRTFLVEWRGERVEYNAIRSGEWVYVVWSTGGRELYDLRADPYQLENRAGAADPALTGALAGRLRELMRCSGSTCRAAEDLPLP